MSNDQPSSQDETNNKPNSSPAQSASASKKVEAKAKAKPKSSTPAWLILLVLILLAAVAALGYWSWLQYQQQSERDAANAQWQQRLNSQSAQLQKLQAQQQQEAQNQSAWQQTLRGIDDRLQNQAQRLRSLSTTTREDWQLAEAAYLVRLAQQRLLMERSSQGAVAMLESADDILRQLDDADLFAVRDKLQRDIASLKLLPQIDRTGLYLRLDALIQVTANLPVKPQTVADKADASASADAHEQANQEGGAEEAANQKENSAMASIGARITESFWAAMHKLAQQVRIRHSDAPIKPMLTPEQAAYLKQNLRFYLEQAQLAMLREDAVVYKTSLDNAVQLLNDSFNDQPRAQKVVIQLQELASQPVSVTLPSIQGSLLALQAYIEKLHKLDSSAGSPQLTPSPSTVPTDNSNSGAANP